MPDVSRRSFVTKASIGVAAVGALAIAKPLSADAHDDTRPAASPGANVVAHLRDVKTGIVDIFIGERQITVVDQKLANGLARAAKG